MEIDFYNGVTDAYQGQINGILWIFDRNRYPSGFDCRQKAGPGILGYIEWSRFEENTTIQMIEVLDGFRRKGFGTKLIDYFYEHTAGVIEFSALTEDGEFFVSSVDPVKKYLNRKTVFASYSSPC